MNESLFFAFFRCVVYIVTWFRWHIRSSLTKYSVYRALHCHNQKGNTSVQLDVDVKGKSFIWSKQLFFQWIQTQNVQSKHTWVKLCYMCICACLVYGNHNHEITKLPKCVDCRVWLSAHFSWESNHMEKVVYASEEKQQNKTKLPHNVNNHLIWSIKRVCIKSTWIACSQTSWTNTHKHTLCNCWRTSWLCEWYTIGLCRCLHRRCCCCCFSRICIRISITLYAAELCSCTHINFLRGCVCVCAANVWSKNKFARKSTVEQRENCMQQCVERR